jgi:hypothetical protein
VKKLDAPFLFDDLQLVRPEHDDGKDPDEEQHDQGDAQFEKPL